MSTYGGVRGGNREEPSYSIQMTSDLDSVLMARGGMTGLGRGAVMEWDALCSLRPLGCDPSLWPHTSLCRPWTEPLTNSYPHS